MPICRGKTFKYKKASILSYAAVVGKTENDGPYGGEFDDFYYELCVLVTEDCSESRMRSRT